MCEYSLTIDVADVVYVGHDLVIIVLGQDLHVFVNGDEAMLSSDADLIEFHVGGVGDSAGGNHSCIKL